MIFKKSSMQIPKIDASWIYLLKVCPINILEVAIKFNQPFNVSFISGVL